MGLLFMSLWRSVARACWLCRVTQPGLDAEASSPEAWSSWCEGLRVMRPDGMGCRDSSLGETQTDLALVAQGRPVALGPCGVRVTGPGVWSG